MKIKNVFCTAIAAVMVVSAFAGCSANDSSANESKDESSQAAVSSSSTQSSNDDKAVADKLLTDISGTYQELWPVILDEKYKSTWIDDSAAIVGEENAEAAFNKMTSMVTGTVTGEKAVEQYSDGNMAYCCEFLQDVDKFTFDGNTISGVDKDNKQLFSHTYHYVGTEDVRGLYIYESDDNDSGEFTYFCLAPDTMATTWHIEFRYGSDLDALKKYDAGQYAYWLAAGISVDCTQQDISDCINLFCTENLSEQ